MIMGIFIIVILCASCFLYTFCREFTGMLVPVVVISFLLYFNGGGTIEDLIRLLETKQVTESIEVAPTKETTVGVTNSVSTTSSGNWDIVEYALKFVGCPYVWGGNSLTNGCDCSHFVTNVLNDTGHRKGGWVQSTDWQYEGEPVESLDQAQAGDVIVYEGHVAIYDGEGLIVEAKGSEWGITHDRAPDCKEIVAIRRFPKIDD